jgi:hypothetical protein
VVAAVGVVIGSGGTGYGDRLRQGGVHGREHLLRRDRSRHPVGKNRASGDGGQRRAASRRFRNFARM